MGEERQGRDSVRQLLATTENRNGMLAGITNAIAESRPVSVTQARTFRTMTSGLIEVTVEVFDKKHLDKVVERVSNTCRASSLSSVLMPDSSRHTFLFLPYFAKIRLLLGR